eukprot:s60_g15.t1
MEADATSGNMAKAAPDPKMTMANLLRGLASSGDKVAASAGDALLAYAGAHPRLSLDAAAAAALKDLLRPLRLQIRPQWALRPHQEEGYRWLMARASAGMGAVLADAMGLGKTRQAIAYILGVREGLRSREALEGKAADPGSVLKRMPALTVNLLSGREVEANLSNFEGNGAELREVVGCALRVTPRRLRLVTANNVEIGDADVISDEIQCPITATVGEGQEIAEFCQEAMPSFTSRPVEDALSLPPGTEELSDGILLGRAMMLAIKKEESRIWRKYLRILKAHNASKWNFDPEEEWEECGYWIKEELKQAMKPHWTRGCRQEARDGLQKCRKAASGFVELDKRLQQKLKLQFFCRWEEHEENGQTKRHRDARLQGWLLAQWDKAASTCILSSWRDRITTVIEVERESDSDQILKLFSIYCSLLTAAHAGQEAAAWIKPYTKTTVEALLKGLKKEAFMLKLGKRILQDWCHGTVIIESMGLLHSTAASVEGLREALLQNFQEGLWSFLGDLAEDRCDPLRFLGMRLLTQYHPANEATQQLFQKFTEFDWPHVREMAKAALEECHSAPESPQSNGMEEASTDCPSPRSLYLRSMKSNPIRLTIPRLGGRRKLGKGNVPELAGPARFERALVLAPSMLIRGEDSVWQRELREVSAQWQEPLRVWQWHGERACDLRYEVKPAIQEIERNYEGAIAEKCDPNGKLMNEDFEPLPEFDAQCGSGLFAKVGMTKLIIPETPASPAGA